MLCVCNENIAFFHAFGEAGSLVAFFTPSCSYLFFFSLLEISSWTSLSKREHLLRKHLSDSISAAHVKIVK